MQRILILAVLMMVSLLAQAAPRTLLVLGDSLSAGYGLPLESAWPSLLQTQLNTKAPDYKVVNLSISGETTAGGRSRLPEALQQHRPALVIIALGANDGLRGLPIPQLQNNLAAMITQARNSGARVILVGMRLPPNYGPYAEKFAAVYPALAKEMQVPLVKFLLEGIADKPQLFQADGLHPIASTQRQVMNNVWEILWPQLK